MSTHAHGLMAQSPWPTNGHVEVYKIVKGTRVAQREGGTCTSNRNFNTAPRESYLCFEAVNVARRRR